MLVFLKAVFIIVSTIVMVVFCIYLTGIINRAFYMPLVKAWAKRESLKLISVEYKVIYKNKRNRCRVQSRYAPTYWITARRADGEILEGFVKFKLRNMTFLGANDLANYQVIADWKS